MQQEWSEAAKFLQGIQLDSGHRVVSDEYKLNIYLKIIRLLLEEENSVDATAYLNRAGLLIPNTTDPMLALQYKVKGVLHASRMGT